MIRHAVTAVVAFLVAVVIGVLIAGGRSGDPLVTSTIAVATTTTSQPRAIFVGEGETVVGPAVIVAGEPYVDGTQLVVTFDLASLAPTADAADVLEYRGLGSFLTLAPEELNTVFLDSWVLTTDAGNIEGGPSGPAARAARFEVGTDFDPASIQGVSIASFSVLTPISSNVSLASGRESAPAAPGITARLLAVTEQHNTIIQIEMLSDRGFNVDNLRVTGAGPGWVAAVREAEGRPRWNLTYDSAAAPSSIDMLVEGSVWVSVDAGAEVVLPEAP